MNIKKHISDSFSLAYPIMISQLGVMMMHVVDSILVGRLGPVPLAAASLAHSYFTIVFVVAIGIALSVTPLVAIAKGENNKEGCSDLLNTSFFVNLLASIILFIIVFLTSPYLDKLNQPKEVADAAVAYTNILAFSLIPASIFNTYKQWIEGLAYTRPGMVISIAANVVNFGINIFVVYGTWGAPNLGLNGAAIGTFSARTFMAIAMFWFVKNSSAFKDYNLKISFKKIKSHVLKRIVSLGVPSGVQYFFEVGAFSFAVVMVGWLGTKQLAAHQIALNLASISFMIITGISAAGAIRVGHFYGIKSQREIRTAGFTAIVSGAALMSISGLTFILFNNLLPKLYIEDLEVIKIASSILIIAAIFQIFDGTQAVGIGVLRGLTDVKGPTIITFISYWIIALPLGYILAFNFDLGIQGVWVGLLFGLVTSATLLTLRFNKKSKNISYL